jgi:hypothetical protein
MEDHVTQWAQKHPLAPIHVDCATAVMLKILDGKCKMNDAEKVIMKLLYQRIKQRPGRLLGDDIHRLIAIACSYPSNPVTQTIYEKRILAETMISRPVMKEFKAMIRRNGLLTAHKNRIHPVETG